MIEARPLRFLARLPAMLLRDHGVAGIERATLLYAGKRLVGWQAFYADGGESILSLNGRRIHQSRQAATLLGTTTLPREAPDWFAVYLPREVPGQPGRIRWEKEREGSLSFEPEEREEREETKQIAA